MSDDLLKGIHDEKTALLKAQRASIEDEIEERRAIDERNLHEIDTEASAVKDEILTLTPDEGSHDPAGTRKTRLELEKERAALLREARAEHVDNWKDVQHLKQEERGVEKELTSTEARKKRLDDVL